MSYFKSYLQLFRGKLGLPWWLRGKESICNAGDARDTVNPWVGTIPWRRAWQSIPVFLPGKLLNRGAFWAIVHRVTQSQT